MKTCHERFLFCYWLGIILILDRFEKFCYMSECYILTLHLSQVFYTVFGIHTNNQHYFRDKIRVKMSPNFAKRKQMCSTIQVKSSYYYTMTLNKKNNRILVSMHLKFACPISEFISSYRSSDYKARLSHLLGEFI